jgi:hypothetical protein
MANLTIPQRNALANSFESFVNWHSKFANDPMTIVKEALPEFLELLRAGLHNEGTCEILRLLSDLPYTIPEDGRDRAVYFRALVNIGAVASVEEMTAKADGIAGGKAAERGAALLTDHFNPEPRDGRVFRVKGRTINMLGVHTRTSTDQVFASSTGNHYIMISNPVSGQFRDRSLRKVDLVSVHRTGEIRWTVQEWEIKSDWKYDPHSERLQAARHFGIIHDPTYAPLPEVVKVSEPAECNKHPLESTDLVIWERGAHETRLPKTSARADMFGPGDGDLSECERPRFKYGPQRLECGGKQSAPPRPAKRFERRCRIDAFPRTLLINIRDLNVGEILVISDDARHKEEIHERISAIDPELNAVETTRLGRKTWHRQELTYEHALEWHILDCPREGSVWEYVDGRKLLRVTEIHGTDPADVQVHFSYIETPENGIVTLEQWQAWRYSVKLIECDPVPESSRLVSDSSGWEGDS